MTRWTSQEAALATGGAAAGEWAVSSVAIDSRAMQPGALLVALKGERADGHAFVAEALAQGALAAMVSRVPPGADAKRLLVVEDTQKALEALGGAGRARARGRIVGVTGSVGKTSMKEMLKLALAAHGNVFASHGNFNNHIGTPLNLANLPPDADFGVLEMGMNHAGELAALTRLVRPHVAVITNVEAAHLEFFGTLEAIADAKCEIFEGLEPGGVAVLNRDNAQFARCRAKAPWRVVTFGRHEEADVRVEDYRATPHGSEMRIGGLTVRMKAIGAQWALMAAAVLACARALGLDEAKTAAALAAFQEAEGRGRLVDIGGGVTLLDDSYNASPAAMRAALAKLAELRRAGAVRGRLLAALGDMRELGEAAPRLHADLAEDVLDAEVDIVFTAGALMQHLHDALPDSVRGEHAADAAALLPIVRAALLPGDMLLVKGSHGSKMYTLAQALIKKEAYAL